MPQDEWIDLLGKDRRNIANTFHVYEGCKWRIYCKLLIKYRFTALYYNCHVKRLKKPWPKWSQDRTIVIYECLEIWMTWDTAYLGGNDIQLNA